jgi:ubiquinone/menaquinone biosynthesis C-methylase UbiE
MQLDPIQQAAQDQFAKRSERYGSGHILADISDVKDAMAMIELPEAARVLDVATGGGHTGLYLAGLGHRVVLADIAEAMLKRASEEAQRRGLTIETGLHPAEKLPYDDGSFDLVTCRVAAHHFSSPELFVVESARVLRPGGSLLLIDNSIEDDKPIAAEWIHRLEKLRDPSHHRLLSPNDWGELCEQNGLRVRFSRLQPFKQPGLKWYFETAATPQENRGLVEEMIRNAPAEARETYKLAEEGGDIVWWWPRVTLIARKL